MKTEDFLSEQEPSSKYFAAIDTTDPFRFADKDGLMIDGLLNIKTFQGLVRNPIDNSYTTLNPLRIPPIDLKNPVFIKILSDLTRHQRLINHCINNAEIIKRRTLDANLVLPFETEAEWRELVILDFMKLKERFCNFIKKNKINEYKFLSTSELRGKFDKFILDRNIYTHGILKLLTFPEDFLLDSSGKLTMQDRNYIFILEYIETKTKTIRYAVVTQDIIEYNISVYREIQRLFDSFFDLHSSLKKK